MNRYHDENMEWFRNLKPVRNDHDEIKQKSTDYEVNVLDQVQGVLNLSKELHNHMNDGLQGFYWTLIIILLTVICLVCCCCFGFLCLRLPMNLLQIFNNSGHQTTQNT